MADAKVDIRSFAHVENPEWVPEKAAAAMLGVHRMTLFDWRHKGEPGKAPTWYRISNRILYKKSDIQAFIEGCKGR